MLRLRNRRGQIAFPAMFILPTLMLFVFLIYETAKLSRVKIRHQFAVDSAAFVEMTNYSDFLNRSAYVNGAFPMRIFWEGFHDTMLDCMGRDPCPGKRPLSDILYEDGVFPSSEQVSPDGNADAFASAAFDLPQWQIRYAPTRTSMDSDEPTVDNPNPKCSGKCVELVSMNTAKYWNINWDDASQIYKLYVQIYQLLGSVESAQYSVLNRLTQQHNFLKKSYWLNTGGDTALFESEGLRNSFDRSASGFANAVHFECAERVYYHGNQLVHSWAQPYQIWSSDPPPVLPSTISECSGLFQAVWVKQAVLNSMSRPGPSGYPGWPVGTSYKLDDSNYFQVPLNRLMQNDGCRDLGIAGPCVHATVAVGGFGAVPSVWRDPTPKYQVRLYP